MSRYLNKARAYWRNHDKVQRKQIAPQPVTVVLTSKQSMDRYGKTDRFWWERVTGREPKFHWQAMSFIHRSQKKRRKLARQSA